METKTIQVFNNKEYKLHEGERYFSRGPNKMHWDVWEYHNGKRKKGFHIHHIDENPHNNDIGNLEEIEASKHLSAHLKQRAINNPEWLKGFMQKGRAAAKIWHASEEGLKWHSELGKISWINREYNTKTCEICSCKYETRHAGDSRFCSNKCKAKYRRDSGLDNIECVCDWCGNTWIKNKYSKAKFCSKVCGGKSRWS